MRTLSKVKSSPMIPRQPDVPNLIIRSLTLAQGGWGWTVLGGRWTGSPFSLRPPCTVLRPPCSLARLTQSSPSMSDRPVLLIADDNEDVVMLLKSFLRPLQCEILVAKDGEEALTVAQNRLPDVV